MTHEHENLEVQWGDYRPLGVNPQDPKLTPAPHQMLAAVEAFFQRYVALPDRTLLPVALWATSTHLFECFTTFPYLAILSAVKGSGKTRLLEICEQVCARPWRASTVSPAAVFRKIASDSPTLLLDEAEVLSNPRSEVAQALRAILNAGYRAGASVPRCEPPKHEVHNFPVFCPKAFTAIGRLPDTIADRSILIQMQKRVWQNR